jgi:hypothetical protein
MARTDLTLPPYPFEAKVSQILNSLHGDAEVANTSISRETYLDIAERIVRQAVDWQDERGAIINPVLGRETFSTSARFVGALGGCIWGGRCEDLVDACCLSMDYCCDQMAGINEPEGGLRGLEFYTKEIMYAYFGLQAKIDQQRHQRWAELMGSYDPWARYPSWVDWRDGNFPIYALCGEQLKTHAGLADSSDAIDAVLDNQFKLISPYGMYRDPFDPFTYDLTVRQQIGMLPRFGYTGRHAQWIDEATRRGALTQLLWTSVTGQMPYGGRSNQYHIMEAMAACICEMEAHRYAGERPTYAGAFKRAAHMAVQSIMPWIMDYEPAYVLKNRFNRDLMHGDTRADGSPYAAYALLIASILGTAYQMADESIPEGPMPADRGGYVMQLWPSFHRTFATCGPYHIEIDNSGQPTHDATGLGRFHKRGIRPETALSMSIPAEPSVNLAIEASPIHVAIGPYVAWGKKDVPLATMADSRHCGGIHAVELTVDEETEQRVAFSLRYSGDLIGADAITEHYQLTADGLRITPDIEGGTLSCFVVPLLATDGMAQSAIERLPDGFRVTYEGAIYEARIDNTDGIDLVVDQREHPNITGIYKLGNFVGDVGRRTFALTLQQAD